MIQICGRYAVLTEDEIIEVRQIIQEISLRLVKDDLDEYRPKTGEVRPTDHAPVIAMKDDGVLFENLKWGFKKWNGSGVIINARSETLQTVDMFSKCLKAGRCVVPAGEYFEWEQLSGGKRKHHMKDKKGNLLYMAGLYRDTNEGREFVIITKNASGDAAKIHDRMPVILRVDQIEAWLSGKLAPEDITKLDFNVDAVPFEDEDNGQLSLF